MIDLDRVGRYRRHFSVRRNGNRRLCGTSGQPRAGVVQLLRVEPTAEERYSHAHRLLHAT
jgi:hypothetical protein